MDKLQEMVDMVINKGEFLEPKVIAGRINKQFEGVKVTPKQIDEVLTRDFDEGEIEYLERKFKGFDGLFHY